MASTQSPLQAKASFRSLSKDIRRRIYLLSGVPIGETVWMDELKIGLLPPAFLCQNRARSLDFFLSTPAKYQKFGRSQKWCTPHRQEHPSWYYACFCIILPYQLLYISPDLSAEVSSIFWTENFFRAMIGGKNGICALRYLDPKVISTFTSLTLVSGYKYKTTFRSLRTSLNPGWELEESIPEPGISERGAQWNKILKSCGNLLVPGRLSLSIVCYAEDVKNMEEVFGPLSLLPRLKMCAIHFEDETFDCLPGLQDAVRKAAEGTIRPLPKPFRFTELPVEIRLQILENTELVCPDDDLALVTLKNRHFPSLVKLCSLGKRARLDHDEGGHFKVSCCQHCKDDYETARCCCRSKGPSYSTGCICWKLHTDLLLVSKGVREDALKILYGKNRFTVPPVAFVPKNDSLVATLRFLKGLQPQSLEVLNRLTLWWPELGWITINCGAQIQFLKLLETMEVQRKFFMICDVLLSPSEEDEPYATIQSLTSRVLLPARLMRYDEHFRDYTFGTSLEDAWTIRLMETSKKLRDSKTAWCSKFP